MNKNQDKKFTEKIKQWLKVKDDLMLKVNVNKNDHEVWYQLGQCYVALGNTSEAIKCLQLSVSLKPDNEKAYIYLSHVQFGINDIDSVIITLQKAIKNFSGSAEAFSLLGGAYMQRSRGLEAEKCFVKSLNIDSTKNNTRMHLGLLQIQLRKYHEAIENLKKILDAGEFLGEVHNYLGSAYQNLEEFDTAIKHYKNAVELMPMAMDPVINLGIIYEKTHRVKDAKTQAEKVLKVDKNHFGANFLCGRIEKRNKNFNDAKKYLENAVSVNLGQPYFSTVVSELGHVFDGMGLYDRAYEQFEKANNAWLATLNNASVDMSEYIFNIKTYQSWFLSNDSSSWVNAKFNSNISDPIFFVGFPRSGTTLMEKILTSHPKLFSSHEEVIIGDIKNNICEILGRNLILPKDLNTLTDDEVLILRNYYFKAVKKLSKNKFDLSVKRFIDKLPLNIINLGLIARIFPNADIIMAIRDPRDCCLSCYMQTFDINHAMANFLTLESTTNLYIEVMKLYKTYKEVLNISMYEYKYEDLVDNMPEVSKQVFEFIGVDWDEKVLKYYENAKNKYVNTPSYQAVTQPIYTQAKARWKNYINHLDPYNDKLRPYIQYFNYEI